MIMNKYTIYCTESQTKKAIELGAQILRIGQVTNTCTNYCKLFNTIVIDDIWYHIPTAEEMMGWLEDIHNISMNVYKVFNEYDYNINYNENLKTIQVSGFPSRKSATLSAINEALKYLTNKK